MGICFLAGLDGGLAGLFFLLLSKVYFCLRCLTNAFRFDISSPLNLRLSLEESLLRLCFANFLEVLFVCNGLEFALQLVLPLGLLCLEREN